MTSIWDTDTLWQALEHTAKRKPNLPCFGVPPRASRAYDPEGMLWSYGEMAERVTRLAETYAAAGYGHGHRVAIMLENRPAFMLHFLALNALGCWAVPLNPEFRSDDLAYILGHSEVDLIVALAEHIANIQSGVTALGRAIPIVDQAHFAETLPRATRASAQLAARARVRKRAHVHVGHHRHAQGLHHLQRVFLLRRRALSRRRRRV